MYGFVYIWKDTKRNLFYVGSHYGHENDGYTGSNVRFKNAYKTRPETFRRRILERLYDSTRKELLYREELWLSLIKDEELHGVKYYNEKKVAAGGDIYSTLSSKDQENHRKKNWNCI
jgi:hypothetical protein